ncbi:MAG: hypothetical protein K0U60_11015, partial [Actinomycetia bacterium]|nr:hypothetical protein [Actinomycetes bacterium]
MVTVAGSNTSGRGLPRMGVLLVAVVGLLLGLLVAMSPAAGAGTSSTTTGPAEGSSSGFAATSTTGETAASDGNSPARGQQSEADAVAYINAQNTGTVTQVSTGRDHTCAVTDGNTVYCWGSNKFGRLGNGSPDDSPVPVRVKAGAQGGEFLTDVASVSAGWEHTCAVTTGNTVYCWGYNNKGQLGNNSATQSNVPVKVSNSEDGGFVNGSVRSVSAGYDHTCAVTTENTVYCWGSNSKGQLGNGLSGSANNSLVPVAVRNSEDGGFVNGSVRSVSAGSFHTCAVTNENTVYCWGFNSYGQLGNGSTEDESPVPVKVADSADGGFVNGSVRSVSAGSYHTCAVTNENTVYCWGYNSYGQLGNGLSGSGNNSSVPVPVAGQVLVSPNSVAMGDTQVGTPESKSVQVRSTFFEQMTLDLTVKDGAARREFFAFGNSSGCEVQTNAAGEVTALVVDADPCSGDVTFTPQERGAFGGVVTLSPQGFAQ